MRKAPKQWILVTAHGRALAVQLEHLHACPLLQSKAAGGVHGSHTSEDRSISKQEQ